MIISKETYDKCCPTYKEAVDKLEIKIAQISNSNVNDVTKFTQLFPEVVYFSRFYFTPPEYWNFIMPKLGKDLPINRVEFWKNLCRHIAQWALLNLCYNTEWTEIKYKIQHDDGSISVYYFNAYDDKHLKLLNFQNDFYLLPGTPEFPPYIVTEQDLVYPHNRLQECMHEYEKKSYPSARLMKRYQEMIPLYHKIKYLERNAEEWFNALVETRDVAFVIHNVERRIGLTKQREYKLLLETYSKYCRFFLDDKEMKEKYKAEMIKYGFHGLSTHKVYSFNVK
uniref:Uncharacterized protein n=1 Tax=Panagrolaimus davidi TaxID=227884 RepID=A0A914P9F5_9BILA